MGDEHCPLCVRKGVKTPLQLFQINMHEAIRLCTLKECPYPASSGKSVADLVVSRDLNEMSLSSSRLPNPISHMVPKPPAAQVSSFGRKVQSSIDMQKNVSTPKPTGGLRSRSDISSVPDQTSDIPTHNKPVQVNSSGHGSTEQDLFVKPHVQETENALPTALNVGYSEETKHNSSVYEHLEVPNRQNTQVPEVLGEGYQTVPTTWKSPEENTLVLEQVPETQSDCLESKNHLTSRCVHQSTEPCYEKMFLQWVNRDALCWLDVSMTFIVHSYWFTKFMAARTFNRKLVLPKLHSVYKAVQDSTRQALQFQHYATLAQEGRLVTLETSIGKIIVKTGGGSINDAKPLSPIMRDKVTEVSGSKEWVMTPTELNERAGSLLNKARKMLASVRDTLWLNLEPRLRCVLGKNDSPVFALPLMLREHRLFQEYFKMKYYWQMDCRECGYQHIDEQEKNLPSFPEVTSDFCMQQPHFLRSCFSCEAPGQRMDMCFQALPDIIVTHFVDGLHGGCVSDYDFCHQGIWYTVKGVVQYTNQPDHFVAWLRDVQTNQWMECDDLKNEICKFSDSAPTFPLNQVHLVMWEKLEAGRDFTPSAGCERLRRLCDRYIKPQRRIEVTELKDFETRVHEPPDSKSPSVSSVNRRRRLHANDVIEVASNYTSSDSQSDSPDVKILLKSRSTAEYHSAKSPEISTEESVEGLSLGGKAAVLVPGLKPLNSESSSSQAMASGGVLRKTSGASSLAERVNDNLRKILAEKKSGIVSHRPEENRDNQADRLQRMREKLQMAKLQQPTAGVKANLTTAFVQSSSVKVEEVQNNKRQTFISHLAMPSAKSVAGTNTAKGHVKNKFSVLHSPSHQRSSVKEMLRALKSSEVSQPVSSQSFTGYHPKGNSEAQSSKKATGKGSQKSSNMQKSKKISFGQEVQVQTVSTDVLKGLKRKVTVNDQQSRQAAKRILVSPKSSPKSKVSPGRSGAGDQTVSESSMLSKAQTVCKQMNAAAKLHSGSDCVQGIPSVDSVDQRMQSSGLLSDLPSSLPASLGRQPRLAIPQLSPCSLRAGQSIGGMNNVSPVAGHVNPTDSSKQAEGMFDDVIGELCATLDAPVTTQHLVHHKVSPAKNCLMNDIHSKEHSDLLDANLPSGVNLNDSEHILPFDFDPSLFGDSPMKDMF